MAIDDATKKKITKLFCEAITSYNEVVELRKSDKEALVEEFNSNLQFYSSIECAFRSVIEQIIGKSCPHNLHEMIEMMVEELTPNPLERGIDLFYILRYKDTRNQTVHNINICEVNAYPKLFLNGYRFIKEYVDKDIEVEPWKEECEEFDYALFNQTFRQSMYDNIRILVLPPLYDSKEKLEILTRYHWNVILDFDPYSGVCGSFSKLNVKNKKLVQLSQIEKYSSTQFSVEDVTYHAAGFGGSTIAKQIAYCLSAEYPVLFMKKYVKEELGSRIAQIYNIAHKRIVVFVEEELFDNVGVQKNECLKIADATSAQVTFVFIARRPQMYDRMSAKEGFFICRYASDDVERIIEFNKNLLADNNKKILSYDGQTFIRKLGEDNLCPFLINLSIYKDEFIKIEEYIRPYVNEINVRPDLKKVFVYVCIFTIFINKGIPIAFFCKKLSVDEEKEWSVIRDKYDPIIYKRYNIEFYISEVVIRAPYMAERLLRSLIGDGEEGILYRKQLSEYLVDLIVDLKLFYTNNGYSEKCLRQLFIDKETNEYVEDEFSDVIVDKDLTIIKKYFAPVIAKLWDKDDINLAGDIFEALINNYPKDSYFYAHAARYYAYTGRDYTKAETYYNRAIKLLDEKDNLQSSQADIYHVKGMCIREELFKNLEGLPEDRDLLSTIDKEPLKELYYRAESAFETTYHIALSTDSKTLEYAYTAWLTLIVRTLTNNRIKLLNDLEIEEEIEKGLTIISSLEDIYYLEENANESDIQRQLADIQRKKETLLSLQKEFKEAVSHWNNYYDIHKNGGNYSNCLYSCKQRYYLLEKETQDFKKITEQNRKRMEKLAADYYEAILHVNYEELKLGDLNTFLSVSIVTNYKVDKVMSKLSGFYQQERKNHILLYYRYVLKFIKAYEGDKLALQECISYMRECCEFSERKPGKANIIDYFAVGEQMGQILSKKRLFRMNTMYRTQAYTAKELRFIYGVLKQQGSETTIIPYDTNGVLMTGIEIHANLKYNPDVEASDSGQMVKLRFGFSYDGLKAENMSIRYADENEEKNEITQERLKEGDYTEFCYKHILTSSKTGKPYGIVGYVDANENCILRIGEITNRRINQEEFAKVIELCQKKNIKVQLIDHTEKGWVASLKSQKLDFENINS